MIRWLFDSSVQGKIRRFVFLMGIFKIPMMGYVRPRIISIDDAHVKLKIKLRRRTKNHLKSIYLGVFGIGADIAAGVHAFYFAQRDGNRISFAFKTMQVDFLKRAETDIIFEMKDGELIKAAYERSKNEKTRVNQEVIVRAFDDNGEEVATICMTSSVKARL